MTPQTQPRISPEEEAASLIEFGKQLNALCDGKRTRDVFRVCVCLVAMSARELGMTKLEAQQWLVRAWDDFDKGDKEKV